MNQKEFQEAFILTACTDYCFMCLCVLESQKVNYVSRIHTMA